MPDPHAHDEPLELADTEFTEDPGYEPPAELAADGPGHRAGRRAPSPLALKVSAVAALVLVVGVALLFHRAHHRRKVVTAGLSQADALLRLDTAAAYRKAASLLEPIAQLDPVRGASARAFALAMLFADYRQADAEAQSENLLVAPVRAETVPPYAQLANAALALGRKEAGSAMTAAARAGDGPWPLALKARVAFVAGNVEAALEPAAAAAAGAFPPGLGLHGDALRRLRKDSAAARAAYEAALAVSPTHPRAVYGLAKLALSGTVPAEEAEAALRRLLADREGTPAPERGRAALHLAALRYRAGDRPGGGAALDAAGLERAARSWAERAAAVSAARRGPYRAVAGAPAALQSASDDDPGELSPAPPPEPAAAKKTVVPTRRTTSKKIAAAKPAAKRKPVAKKRGAKKSAAGKATAKRTSATAR